MLKSCHITQGRVFLFLFILVLSFPFTSQSQISDSSLKTMREFDYEKSTDFKDLKGYAQNEMRGFFRESMRNDVKGWASEIKDQWVKDHSGLKMFQAGVVANQVLEQSSVYRDYLKQELVKKFQQTLPGKVDQFMQDKIFQGASIGERMGGEVQQMIGEVTGQLMGEISGVVNQSIDRWGQTVGAMGMGAMIDPAGFMGQLEGNISQAMGMAAKEGLKGYIDGEMFEKLGANFSEKLNDMVHGAADTLGSVGEKLGELGVASVEELMDKYTSVEALEGQLGELLNKSPLSNIYNLNAADYLGINDALSNMPKLTLPRIEIPAPGMAGIWASAAASHFARAPKCCFWIDFSEIQKGITLIRTLVWQLENKPEAFMLVGGDVGGAGLFGELTSALTGMQQQMLNDVISQVKTITDKMDELSVRGVIDKVVGKLDEFKQQMDKVIHDKLEEMKQGILGEQPQAMDESFMPMEANSEECLKDPSTCNYTEVMDENTDFQSDEMAFMDEALGQCDE